MWLSPWLLLSLFNVALCVPFFEKFCGNYWRASEPGVYKRHTGNMNDGETCLMKFNFHPSNGTDIPAVCEELAPFHAAEGKQTPEGMTCLYMRCPTDEEILIYDRCFVVNLPGSPDCAFGEVALEISKVRKWLTLLYKPHFTYMMVAISSIDIYDVINPESPTDHLALYLKGNAREKLIYLPPQLAAKSPRLCNGDPVTHSLQKEEKYCELLELLGVSTYYDTNTCYVATGSYYPLSSFNENTINARCIKIFGTNAVHAPQLTEMDFTGANQVLKKMAVSDGHHSAFGTSAYLNEEDNRLGPTMARHAQWGRSEGLPIYMFQKDFPIKLFHRDRISFHYAPNNYTSLLPHNQDFHVRQLCKIGKGADLFVPPPDACTNGEVPYVTDFGRIKCIAPFSFTRYSDTYEDFSFCQPSYNQTSMDSEREFMNFYNRLTRKIIRVNAQYLYTLQRTTHLSKFVWNDGRIVIYSRFLAASITGIWGGEEENCLEARNLGYGDLWNDVDCHSPVSNAFYCTRFVE